MKTLRVSLFVAVALLVVSPLAAQNLKEHYFYQDDIYGDIWEISWTSGGSQVQNNLSSSAGASTPNLASPLSVYRISGIDYVAYLISGDVHVLANNSGTVTDADRTSATSANAAASNSQLTNFLVGSYPYVWYQDSSGNIDVIWKDGGGFHFTNMTSYLSAPAAVSGSPLTCYVLGGDLFFDYLTSSGHVETMWYDGGGWHKADLTSDASAPSAATGSPLTSDPTNEDNIYYLDSSGNVILLYYSSGWTYGNLTSLTSAPAAESASALTAFTSNYQTVCYVDRSNNVQELYKSSGTWYNANLLTQTNVSLNGLGPAAFAPLASAFVYVSGTGYDTDVVYAYWIVSGGYEWIVDLYFDGATWNAVNPNYPPGSIGAYGGTNLQILDY